MNVITAENILGRAAELGYPAAPLGLGRADEVVWRATVATASQEKAQEISERLDAHARRLAEEREVAERERIRRVAQGLEPPSPEEQAEADRIRREAQAEFERHERERPRRVEELLAGILAELKRAR